MLTKSYNVKNFHIDKKGGCENECLCFAYCYSMFGFNNMLFDNKKNTA